ncbi:tyrosine-type recombinase/integrase [Sphingomonas canadensis]|uniref:Tyrosine-type recombinase/integrase n=1 Tax=Sphingomonas canadensis TaxID=1219257 RepID=A0ABW3H987_9SPHN|nr:tyrosine-type recombinase/integrase [Sphingomonas canadensis]MCW3837085.1 tyrosine-type recombinase/integrase [Sphingomonas canadensis]
MARPPVATGAHVVPKKLASGLVWYVYAWRGGPQVARIDGPAKPKKLSPDILNKIAEAQAERQASATKEAATLRSLIRLWRSENPNRPSSPEWHRLAATTKKTWGAALDAIEAKWGDVPLTVFSDPRMKAKVVEWRDSRSSTPRGADIGVTVLKALLKFGTLRGKVLINVADGIPSLCGKNHADRAEIIWTDDDLTRFQAAVVELDMLPAWDALRLAVASGLRREDLATLTWDEIGPSAIVKKAKKRSRGERHFVRLPRVPELEAVLADLKTRRRASDTATVLVDECGKPWHLDRLTKAVAKVRDHAGIAHVDPETGQRRTKHLHDARGTFATKLMLTGKLTDQQVAEYMGWSAANVSRIRHVYVDQTAIVVAIGERINAAV